MGNPFGALEAAVGRRSPLPPAQKKPIGKAQQPEGGRSWPEAGGLAALSAAERQGKRANRQHARRDAPGESARKFSPAAQTTSPPRKSP